MSEDNPLVEIKMKLQEIDNRLINVEKKFDKVDGNVSKAVWLILSTMIIGVMSFLLGGGLFK